MSMGSISPAWRGKGKEVMAEVDEWVYTWPMVKPIAVGILWSLDKSASIKLGSIE